MSYDAQEASGNRNSKVYLYLFEMGGIDEWAYTSDAREVEVDGITYVPEVISHDDQSAEANEGSQTEQKIEVPFDNPVAVLHVAYLPPRPVQVTIQSFQRNDVSGEVKTHFRGEINSFQQRGGIAELRCSQANDPTGRRIPRATHGQGCRHNTYGPACTLDREDWKTVIDDLTDIDGFTLKSPSFLAAGTDYFKRGYLENPITGEVRYVTYHVGDTVKVIYPFTDLVEADTLWAFAGDDKQPETCRVKFGNKPQYLGFDHFPSFNVFATGVRNGAGNCGPGNGTTYRNVDSQSASDLLAWMDFFYRMDGNANTVPGLPGGPGGIGNSYGGGGSYEPSLKTQRLVGYNDMKGPTGAYIGIGYAPITHRFMTFGLFTVLDFTPGYAQFGWGYNATFSGPVYTGITLTMTELPDKIIATPFSYDFGLTLYVAAAPVEITLGTHAFAIHYEPATKTFHYFIGSTEIGTVPLTVHPAGEYHEMACLRGNGSAFTQVKARLDEWGFCRPTAPVLARHTSYIARKKSWAEIQSDAVFI